MSPDGAPLYAPTGFTLWHRAFLFCCGPKPVRFFVRPDQTSGMGERDVQERLFDGAATPTGVTVLNDRCVVRTQGTHRVVLVAGVVLAHYAVGDLGRYRELDHSCSPEVDQARCGIRCGIRAGWVDGAVLRQNSVRRPCVRPRRTPS